MELLEDLLALGLGHLMFIPYQENQQTLDCMVKLILSEAQLDGGGFLEASQSFSIMGVHLHDTKGRHRRLICAHTAQEDWEYFQRRYRL